MVLLAQISLFFDIQPFAQWYFPIAWFGYIFLVDALVYSLRGKSLIKNRPNLFVVLLVLSSVVWWMFEYIGFVVGNWYYTGLEGFGSKLWKLVFSILSFSTVIPSVFETAELFKVIHLFDHIKLHKRHKITIRLLYMLIGLGVVSFVLPLVYPLYFFPLVWVSFFLILDPVNYIHGQPSIISHLKDRKLSVPLSLLTAGFVCGLLWEFWNFYAVPKWHYSIPFVGFFRIFEMPILGYLGYGPFTFELYAMYNFMLGLVKHKKSDIFRLVS